MRFEQRWCEIQGVRPVHRDRLVLVRTDRTRRKAVSSYGEASTPNASEQGFSWNLVAVDPEQVRVLVRHYGHRYPALDWSWLLQSLAELRLVGEPRLAVTKLLEQQQLESAERFLLDVGLWVVAGRN